MTITIHDGQLLRKVLVAGLSMTIFFLKKIFELEVPELSWMNMSSWTWNNLDRYDLARFLEPEYDHYDYEWDR